MAVRRALAPADPTGTVQLQELDDTNMNSIHSTYAEYVYSLYPATTLTVVGSGGNLPGLPMTDTRYQAGTSTSRVDRFATEAETPNISIITVNYSRISQSFASNTTPVDTNNLRYPLYLYNDGSNLQLRAMSSTDFYDTFVTPAINIINNSVNSVGDYYISTSLTPANGSILVSSTPVYTDTRANLAAYSSGSIPETPDQPSTINNYYLHVYGTNATDGNDLPLYLDANDEQIKQYTLAQWAATLGPWLQYHYINLGDAPSYEINGIGTTQGSVMLNTILSPTGTGYSTRYVNTNDYRTQEFPNGTPVTANTYELKKFTPTNSFGALNESISYTLSSTGEVTIGASASVSISYTLEAVGEAPGDAGFAGSLPFTLDSGGEVLIEGIASVDTSYSLSSAVPISIEGTADVSVSYTLIASTISDADAIFTGTLPFTLDSEGNVLIQGIGDVSTSYTVVADGVVLIQGIGDVNTSYTLSASTDIPSDADFAGSLPYTLSSEGDVLIEGTASVDTSYSLASEGEILGPIEGTTSVSTSYSLASEGEVTLKLLDTLDNPNAYSTSDGDGFGYSSAMYGNYAIIGAPYEEDAGGSSSGKAYIFNSANGQLLHTLNNPNAYGTSVADQFGYSVAISDSYAIVGATYEDASDGFSSGKAYIFHVANGALAHTLDNPNAYDTGTDDRFGNSVGITDNYAIVGAYEEDDSSGILSGKVYIFHTANGALAHTLDNPNPVGTSGSDRFGKSVSISGNYAIVGAYGEDDAAGFSNPGKAYIFHVANGALAHTLDNPNEYGSPQTDEFGYSVAISDNYAIVGAWLEDGGGTASGQAYIFHVANGALAHSLDNPNAYGTSDVDYFGWSVAISGNYAIVGARQEDDAGGTQSGKAYIFSAITGDLLHTIHNTNAYGTSENDEFGWSVAISDNRAIVATRQEDDAGGNSSGKAYIYELPGTILQISVSDIATIDNPNVFTGATNDSFGRSVAVSGSYAISGAQGEDDGGAATGTAYIFNSANGQLLHTLDNPNTDEPDNDAFGSRVAMSSSYSIVGAPNWSFGETGNFHGAAYIFNNANGALLHTLPNPIPAQEDNFGNNIDISESYAIVGDNTHGSSFNSGKAYIYSTANGALLHTLDNPNAYSAASNDEFGWSVAISEDYAAVGARYEDDASGTSSGKVYVFSTANGALLHTIDNPNPYGTSASDLFGYSVDIDGDNLIVGALLEDTASTSGAGRAYIFDITTGVLLQTLKGVDNVVTGYFGEKVSISGNYAVVGEIRYPDVATESGRAYVFNVTNGHLLAVIENPNAYGTIVDDRFGGSVSISGNTIFVGTRSEDEAGASSSGKAYLFSITEL